MRNFRNFADMLQNFPVDESPGQPPMSSAMPDELALAAQQEALEQPHVMPDALNKAAQQEAIQQAVVAKPAPAPQSGVNRQGLDQAMANFKGVTPEGTMAKTGPGVTRAPAVEGAAEPESEMSRLEKLMQQMNAQRKQEMEDAASRQMKTQMLKGITDNLGLLMAGSQAMNTKAGVQAPQVKSIDVGDLVGQVERKFKPEQEQLLSEYKALKDKNQPLSEKDKAYLALGWANHNLGNQRAGDAQERFHVGESNRMYKFSENMREKQELNPAQKKEIIGVDTTIDSLNKLDGMKDFSTGPLSGRIEKIKRFVGVSPGNRVAMQAQLNMIISQYGKAVSGSQIGEGEFQRIQSQLPNENDSDEQFAAKLANFKDTLQDSRDRMVYTYKAGGQNPGELATRKSIEEIRGTKNQSTQADDPRIDKFMQKNGIKDRNEAIKILKDKGLI